MYDDEKEKKNCYRTTNIGPQIRRFVMRGVRLVNGSVLF